VVVGPLEGVVVDVAGDGVVGTGAREIFTGVEWKLNTPASPATVPKKMIGVRFN
jgi:hypothetical protein